jgi:hypothetical protein
MPRAFRPEETPNKSLEPLSACTSEYKKVFWLN